MSCIKKLSTLLRGITSKHHGYFYGLNYLHSAATENRLNLMKKHVRKGFFRIAMPSEKDNTLEFNQHMKSDKMPYIIYADIEYLIKKVNGCANNPENFLTTKIGEHIPCECSMSTIWAFDHI